MKRFVAFVLLVVLCASLVLTVAMAASCGMEYKTDCSGCFDDDAKFVCKKHELIGNFYQTDCIYVPNQCEVRGSTTRHKMYHSCGYGGGAYDVEVTEFYHKTCGHDADIPPIILAIKDEKE